jgi:hypothetical protein
MRRLIVASAAVAALTACSTASTGIQDASTEEGTRQVALTLTGCFDETTSEVVEETETEVRVRVDSRRESDNDCLSGATVTLDEPLGDRRLINDANDVEIAVARSRSDVAVQSVSGHGRTVEAVFDSCGEDLQVEVSEGADEVAIYATVAAEVPQLCALGQTLTLEAPLGDRRVIDGTNGDEVTVEPG